MTWKGGPYFTWFSHGDFTLFFTHAYVKKQMNFSHDLHMLFTWFTPVVRVQIKRNKIPNTASQSQQWWWIGRWNVGSTFPTLFPVWLWSHRGIGVWRPHCRDCCSTSASPFQFANQAANKFPVPCKHIQENSSTR